MITVNKQTNNKFCYPLFSLPQTLISVFFIGILVTIWGFRSTDAPQTRAELGKKLFFDPILSSDRSVSCASCHKPEFAFADTVAFSGGVNGKLTRRNTPTAMNTASRSSFFWDGRSATLAEQALQPIQNPDEMNLPIEEAVRRLRQNEQYRQWFKDIFGKQPNSHNLGEAIAAFEQTLETANTPWDKYVVSNDSTLITATVLEGSLLFRTKARCVECHFTPDFTGDEFRNIGLYDEQQWTDKGRFDVTKNPDDLGRFKVPGLRNVAVTAPYMHNGQFKTLAEVVHYYNQPQLFVQNPINRDTVLNQELLLTTHEEAAIVAFLESLTDKQFEGNR